MTHGPEHHIEHAEHAAHAAGDSFNRQVTMSIAIVAAVLACVTMLAHRAHTDTLRLQGEALDLQTRASINSTDSADKWAYYQTKNIFNLESEITVDLLDVIPIREDRKEQFDKIRKRYSKNVAEYRGIGYPKDEKKKNEMNEEEKKKAEGKLKRALKDAVDSTEETKKLQKESKIKMDESHVEHAKADRFDFGELGLQFGVVLCSLAILTKGRALWFGGLASSVVGAAVAASGQFGWFMGHH
jgi:Domain of unknown function (DUF4337)